jgi:hypothetical protein
MKKVTMNDIKPEDYWPEAKKMIDRHFRLKRIRIALIFFSTALLFIAGAWLWLGQPFSTSEKNNIQKPAHVLNVPEQIKNLQKNTDNTQTDAHVTVMQSETLTNPLNSVITKPAPKTEQHTGNVSSTTPVTLNDQITASAKTERSPSRFQLKNKPTDVDRSNAQTFSSPHSFNKAENYQLPVQVSSSEQINLMTSVWPLLPTTTETIALAPRELIQSMKSFPGEWRVLLYYYAGNSYKDLKGNNDEYINRRKSEEDALLSGSFGAQLKYDNNKTGYSAGIEYATYGEEVLYTPVTIHDALEDHSYWQQFTNTYTDTDTTYIYGISFFRESQIPFNDSTYIFQTDTVKQKTSDASLLFANGKNRITYIEIPLEFTYYLSRHRLGFGITAGVSPGFLTSRKGYYLKADQSGAMKLEETNGFKKVVLNARLSLDICYRLNSTVNLVLRPQFRTGLSDVVTNPDFSERYYGAGIGFGTSILIK